MSIDESSLLRLSLDEADKLIQEVAVSYLPREYQEPFVSVMSERYTEPVSRRQAKYELGDLRLLRNEVPDRYDISTLIQFGHLEALYSLLNDYGTSKLSDTGLSALYDAVAVQPEEFLMEVVDVLALHQGFLDSVEHPRNGDFEVLYAMKIKGYNQLYNKVLSMNPKPNSLRNKVSRQFAKFKKTRHYGVMAVQLGHPELGISLLAESDVAIPTSSAKSVKYILREFILDEYHVEALATALSSYYNVEGLKLLLREYPQYTGLIIEGMKLPLDLALYVLGV